MHLGRTEAQNACQVSRKDALNDGGPDLLAKIVERLPVKVKKSIKITAATYCQFYKN